ncbi:MAG: ABC transporter ATP-binding protein [Candidatus Gastranaerophilales bacterium]|nr:ABC transporter ATP-binding protein [Candidatus Gastranaerophilales bacterium]
METLSIFNLNLGFEIGEKFYPAVKDFSFELKKGQIHAMIGESGSGKTMSVMSIIRLLPKNAKITSGKILYNGVDILTLSEKDMNKIRGKRIALIMQDPMTCLNPLYTIENQMVEAILAHNKCTKNEAREIALKNLLDVNIKDAKDKLKVYPHELSGGLKQRVVIAIALSLDPDIIIADEPTTALDVTVQAQILEILAQIKNKGKSIILISHDLGIVSRYSDYISIMYSGRIVEAAPSHILFKNPKHPYTKALMEALPYSKEKRLKNIKGAPPPITKPVCGCEFHPRCEYKEEICKNKIFTLVKQEDNSKAACRLYDV